MTSNLWVSTSFVAILGIHTDFGLQRANFRMLPESSPPPITAEQLTEQFGCDETFVAKDSKSTSVLSVQMPGLLKRSQGQRLPYSEELAVGGNAVVVRLESGTNLNHWCTDLMERPPRIVAVWIGVSGQATVVLVERQTRDRAEGAHVRTVPISAILRVKEVILMREYGGEGKVTLPDLEIAATLGVPGGG
jgi:hypothetical protein